MQSLSSTKRSGVSSRIFGSLLLSRSLFPAHCQRPSLRVLSWPEINGGVYPILGVPRQRKWSHRSPPSALWPSTESLPGTSAITPGTAGINL